MSVIHLANVLFGWYKNFKIIHCLLNIIQWTTSDVEVSLTICMVLQWCYLACICRCHCIMYKSSKSMNQETRNIFFGCFGRDMLFSKLDTFYGPAASYIQFPNTHIPTLKKQRDFCFSSSFNAMLGAETPELNIVRSSFFRRLSCHWNNLLEIHIHFSFWMINFELSTSLIKAVCRLFILKFESLNMFLCERRKTILDQVTEPWPCISPVPSFQTKWLLKHKNLQLVKRRKVSMQNFPSNNRNLF